MRRLPAPRGQRAASIHSACIVWLVLALGTVLSDRAHAEPMDPVLSRLRVVGGRAGCDNQPDGARYCKNSESFERLASELAVSLAPPLLAPAASDGPSGLALSLDMSITSVDANAEHWRSGAAEAPDPMLVWTHATLRKGLPFGLEVGTTIGRGHATSLWALGLSLKWAIVEGFHTGVGALPDVALQATTTRGMGLDDLTLATHTVDLLLSKRVSLGRGYRLAPMIGLQFLYLQAESGLVDLTPGPDKTGDDEQTVAQVDAFEACKPGAPDLGESVPLHCTVPRGGADFGNNVQFDPVEQTRLRMFVGGQLQFGIWRFSTSFGFDLIAPKLEATRRQPAATEPTIGRQLAFSLAAGAVL